ncbi:MAG: O-antigen chain terminator bifunctional methyltransferase/kinase WbdD [Sodalis sp. Psp]|nr:O-antigen chain terminator bifunctional methyltransferase/kinase WbdD [Sodalis sp. Psp]MCR3756749.1 O-antigen chain terminator bifunctional methyltransferase/kinase WbdD [Sodalis sp. Ppy]
MNKSLRQLVSELPEVYQIIYGHPEWQDASRNCYDRMDILSAIYDQLVAKLGPTPVGTGFRLCAGIFCFSLAEHSATVKRVDFLEQNIALCHALSNENPQLDVSLATNHVEDIIGSLEPSQYNLAMGLSVFYHIIYLHGVKQVQSWLIRLTCLHRSYNPGDRAARGTTIWAIATRRFERIVAQVCFYHEVARFKTHLSTHLSPSVCDQQPLAATRGSCALLGKVRDWLYAATQGAYHGSWRYYFGICKVINFNVSDGPLLEAENRRNKADTERRVLLSVPPLSSTASELLEQGINDHEGWLLTGRFPGKLLQDWLLRRDTE